MSSTQSPAEDRFDRREKALLYTVEDARKIFEDLFPGELPTGISLLSGGFSNANFLVTTKVRNRVIRFYPDGASSARREQAVLALAEKAQIKVPRVIKLHAEVVNTAACVLEFIEGNPLAELLIRGRSDLQQVFFDIGAQLARIHSVKFESSGLFSEDARVAVPFDDSGDGGLQFIEPPLMGRAGKRLGAELANELLQFARSNWDAVRKSFTGSVLVHSDFNPKNLMADERGNVTVMDWEFALAGHSLIDLGNFLRFEEDYDPELVEEFLSGYQTSAGPLPADWKLATKLLDLVNMCSFLNLDHESPKTFRTAKSVIEKTLSRYSPSRYS